MGRACLLYAAGDEGGARLLRRDDPFGGARDPGSGALEARDPLGGGPHPRAQADPLPVVPAQRSRRQDKRRQGEERDERRFPWTAPTPRLPRLRPSATARHSTAFSTAAAATGCSAL